MRGATLDLSVRMVRGYALRSEMAEGKHQEVVFVDVFFSFMIFNDVGV